MIIRVLHHVFKPLVKASGEGRKFEWLGGLHRKVYHGPYHFRVAGTIRNGYNLQKKSGLQAFTPGRFKKDHPAEPGWSSPYFKGLYFGPV